ncbi:pyrroloquinoline quinone precursor peptide PqqA [Dapis sp. BLCC M126]|uniref:pyrroloquinoline quinone precursor peptide PqqA n=1 Tax=Dapis sp. BLCC M126 TaxID=3400189 RepID=UPI003CF27590
MNNTNNYSICGNKDINLPNINTKKGNSNSHNSPEFKPATVWESPSFEEFSLCMEVTAYIQKLD